MNKNKGLCLVFALFSMAACTLTGRAPRSQVCIVDAETGAQIPDAVLELHYLPRVPESPDPDHPRLVANAQGEITVPSTPKPAIWQVRAEGYMEQQMTGDKGALPPRYAAHAGGGYDAVIHLYRMPEPQLTLLVGEDYVGPLTIHLKPAPGFDYVLLDDINVTFAAVDPQASYVQGAPGRRDFVAPASPQGEAYLVAAPLLFDIRTDQLQVRDGSGILPHRELANQDPGRGVWGEANLDDKILHRQIRLFVGTLPEYQEYLQSG